MNEKKIALLIISDDYSDTQFKALKAPQTDGEQLASVLRDKTIGQYDVQLIVNNPHYKILERIEASLKNCGRNDLVILYFSGHGIKDDRGQLFFATTNTNTDLLMATAISATTINDLMARCRSKRKVLLLDTCYSGAFAKGMTHKAGGQMDVRSFFEQGTGHVVMTASDAMQYAFEEDGIRGESKGSIFTSTIVEGLKTGRADVDADGMISFDDLYDFVRSEVSEKRPEQQPHKWLFGVEGKLILAKNPNPAAKALPEDIVNAINSPIPSVVIGGIEVLIAMLEKNDLGETLAAKQALESLVDHDSKSVSSSARKALALDRADTVQPDKVVAVSARKPVAEEPATVMRRDPAGETFFSQKPAAESQINSKWFSLVAFGMLFGLLNSFSVDMLTIQLFPLQIWFSFVIGYRYHRRFAIIAGALIFFPNLIYHLIGLSAGETDFVGGLIPMAFRGSAYAGRAANLFYSPLSCRTLGLAYFYYALFPLAVAVVKAKLDEQSESTDFISDDKLNLAGSAKFVMSLVILLISFAANTGAAQLEGFYAIMVLMSLWIYRYGLEQTRGLFAFFMMTQIISFRTDTFIVFRSVNDVDLPVFLLLMVGYSRLKIDRYMPENYLGYIWAMIFICFFLNFSFNPTPRIWMVMAAFALPLIFILGHKYGSRLGLRAGIILGCIAALSYRLSDSIYWGGFNTDFILGAPLIGYLGGIDFVRKDFLANGMKIFGAYYGAVLIASVLTYGFDLVSRADDLINIGFSLALLLFLSIFTQKSEQAEKINV
jgi:hypothetical protein